MYAMNKEVMQKTRPNFEKAPVVNRLLPVGFRK